MRNQSHILFVRKVNAIQAYPKFLQFSMLFQHWRKRVGTHLPSETQQMREWMNGQTIQSKQTNITHNAFCLHYGQSIASPHCLFTSVGHKCDGKWWILEQWVSHSGGYGERICHVHPTHTSLLWLEFSTPISTRIKRSFLACSRVGLSNIFAKLRWRIRLGLVTAAGVSTAHKSGHQQHCPLIWQWTRSDSSNWASTPRILNISILVKGCWKRFYWYYTWQHYHYQDRRLWYDSFEWGGLH